MEVEAEAEGKGEGNVSSGRYVSSFLQSEQEMGEERIEVYIKGFDPCIPCLTKAELKVENQRCGAGGTTSPGGGLTVQKTRTFVNLPCSLNYARPYCSG